MTKACASVRPRMKASGATSISPVPSRLRELLGRQHVVERVVERPQIGIDLLAQVAGQEAQPLARLDRRPRQDDPVDAAAHQQVDRGGDREIGLAGAGGPEAEDQLVLAQRLDIGRLRRASAARCGACGCGTGVVAPQAEALVVELGLGEPQRGLDRRRGRSRGRASAGHRAATGRAWRHLGRRGRAGDGEPVAARHQRHAELLLDAVEVLVALAVKQRQQQIVVEFELSAAGLEPAPRRRRCGAQRRSCRHRRRRARRRGCWRCAPDRQPGTMSPMRLGRRRRRGRPADRGCGRPAGRRGGPASRTVPAAPADACAR